jgi:hypothetical protein
MFGLGFICGSHPGRLLSTYGLRLPCFAAAGFCLLNWVYGFFVLPESLPADRRSAIDFAKANPFTALMALTKVQGIAAWCGSLFLPPSLNSFCNRPGFSTQRFDSGGDRVKTAYRYLLSE